MLSFQSYLFGQPKNWSAHSGGIGAWGLGLFCNRVFITNVKATFFGMFEGLGLQPCLCVPASLTTKIWVRIALSACLSHLQAELRIKLSCLNAHSRMLKKHLSTCLDLSCAHLIPGLRMLYSYLLASAFHCQARAVPDPCAPGTP